MTLGKLERSCVIILNELEAKANEVIKENPTLSISRILDVLSISSVKKTLVIHENGCTCPYCFSMEKYIKLKIIHKRWLRDTRRGLKRYKFETDKGFVDDILFYRSMVKLFKPEAVSKMV